MPGRKPSLKKPSRRAHVKTPDPPKLNSKKQVFNWEGHQKKWKPGQSGNPHGRRPDPPELKQVKKLTRLELVELGNLIVKNDLQALMWVASGEGTHSVLLVMLARVCVSILQKGDMQKLNQLLDRLIGPTRADVHLTSDGTLGGALTGAPSRIVIMLPSNGRELALPVDQPKTIDAEATAVDEKEQAG